MEALQTHRQEKVSGTKITRTSHARKECGTSHKSWWVATLALEFFMELHAFEKREEQPYTDNVWQQRATKHEQNYDMLNAEQYLST